MNRAPHPKHRVAILDMQPIDPPVGGGRLRLLGLYHGLGVGWNATYVGSYDWPGPGPRELRHSACLHEIDVPLSDAHFQALERWNARVNCRNLADVSFGFMGRLSPAYVARAASVAAAADVVVFSHPWIYLLVRKHLTSGQLVVYDAQNVEALLRAEIWDDGGPGTEVVKHVIAVERALALRADVVLSCSSDDARLFRSLYDLDPRRIWDVPNGVFTSRIRPPDGLERMAAKRELGVTGHAAIFIGSAFAPNVEAVRFILSRLAPDLPGITFLICGGVADAGELVAAREHLPVNVRFVGAVSEEDKQRYLWAADMAVNPMFTGSGTNIKMLDFMAAGLPVVSTAVGARGIETATSEAVSVCEPDAMSASMASLTHGERARRAGAAARALVLERYSWEQISPSLGERLSERVGGHRKIQRVNGTPGAVADDVAASRGHAQETARRRLGLMSTWNARCGISEYSRYLATGLEAHGWECLVLSCVGGIVRAHPTSASDIRLSVEDVQAIQGRREGDVLRACRDAGIERLLVQHHPGFMNDNVFVDIVTECCAGDIDVFITCHNTERMSAAVLVVCADAGATIFVHNHVDAWRLKAAGVHRVLYVPVGVPEAGGNTIAPRRGNPRPSEAPIIGTFGFLRRHKGFAELIDAFAMIREIYPESGLVAMTALYPSEDSSAYLSECRARLAQHGLDKDERVVFDHWFHDMAHVVERLKDCDVLVLPYHSSDEGASSSVNVAMSLGKPVITTRASIFRDVLDTVYSVETPDPAGIALAVCNVLSNTELYDQLGSRVSRYADERAWSRVSQLYDAALRGTGATAVAVAPLGLVDVQCDPVPDAGVVATRVRAESIAQSRVEDVTLVVGDAPVSGAGVDYEARLQRVYEAALRVGDVAIDVGAHVGRHCVPMALRVAPFGRVHAFEPLAICVSELTRLVADKYPQLTQVLEVRCLALADVPGEAPFVIAHNLLAYSGLRQGVYDSPTRTETVSATVETLDRLFDGRPAGLRYIKVGAQGGEFHVLKGAERCLRKYRPLVSFGFGMASAQTYDVDPGELHRFLSGLDYVVCDIDARRLTEPEFRQSSDEQRLWDYLAVPRERTDLLGLVRDTLREGR